jgi:hypothetical protein
MTVSHRHDQDPGGLHAIHDTERIPPQQVVPRAVLVRWPRFRVLFDGGDGRIYLVGKPGGGGTTSVRVLPCCRFGFLDRLIEVLKRAAHVQRPREYGDAPLTTALSSLGRRRLARAARGSPRTTPPRHRRQRPSQGFELARQPAPRAPLASAAVPHPAVVEDSYTETTTRLRLRVLWLTPCRPPAARARQR